MCPEEDLKYFLVASMKHCSGNAKPLPKLWQMKNCSFPCPFYSWSHEFGQGQKCGSLVQRKFIVIMDSDCSLAICGSGQENLQYFPGKVVCPSL